MRDACLQTPDPLTYKPNIFFTTALNQTKVECTWDETPRDRLAITMKKYTEDDLKNASFNEILASSSSEEESQDESQDEKEAEELKKKQEQEQKEKEKKSAKKGNKSTNKNDEEERIKKFRELLLGNESKKNKKRDVDLEFAWEGGMKEEGFDDALFDADDTSWFTKIKRTLLKTIRFLDKFTILFELFKNLYREAQRKTKPNINQLRKKKKRKYFRE